MRARLTWIAGAIGVAGVTAYRKLRRQPVAVGVDPRAEELKEKLAESRTLVEEREEFEAAETPVDKAEPVTTKVEDRRKQVHQKARATADKMKRPSDE
jgi:hypothetical protein